MMRPVIPGHQIFFKQLAFGSLQWKKQNKIIIGLMELTADELKFFEVQNAEGFIASGSCLFL